MNPLTSELRRLHRGLVAMREAFGWQFAAAILLTAALLLWALLNAKGGVAFVMGLVCVLLAIRAHDLGEDPPQAEEPTEFSTFWADPTEAQRQAGAAQARFLKQRHETALGKLHESVEL